MHMADALLSPAVGGTMWALTASTVAFSCRRLRQAADETRVPLMGVMGAFIFTAQMINFTIPATGSSGHLGGGLLLAVLLGPYAAFLVMTSVLAIQALFFADGGLLALGANIFNLGFFPCFIAYGLVYTPLVCKKKSSAGRTIVASTIAAVTGCTLGATAVVLETVSSGISALPLVSFAALMLPVHLAIGLVEGLVTAAVVNFIRRAEPGFIASSKAGAKQQGRISRVLVGLVTISVLTGGVLSWFASTQPDGLEWTIARLTGSTELPDKQEGIKKVLAGVQKRLAVMPGYDFSRPDALESMPATHENGRKPSQAATQSATSTAGLVGGLFTLVLAVLVGLALKSGRHWKRASTLE